MPQPCQIVSWEQTMKVHGVNFWTLDSGQPPITGLTEADFKLLLMHAKMPRFQDVNDQGIFKKCKHNVSWPMQKGKF